MWRIDWPLCHIKTMHQVSSIISRSSINKPGKYMQAIIVNFISEVWTNEIIIFRANRKDINQCVFFRASRMRPAISKPRFFLYIEKSWRNLCFNSFIAMKVLNRLADEKLLITPQWNGKGRSVPLKSLGACMKRGRIHIDILEICDLKVALACTLCVLS